MAIFNQELPEWQAPGSKPASTVIADGWKVGDRPPAAWFNWAWHQAYECIKEIRDYLTLMSQDKDAVELITATYSSGNYIASSATPNAFLKDGMMINLKVSTNSIAGSKLNLDGLGLRDIYVDGSLINVETMQAQRIYTLVYNGTLGGWVITNLSGHLELPMVYTSNVNSLVRNASVIVPNTASNVPNTNVANDYFVIVSTQIKDAFGGTTFNVYQRAKSLKTFNEYSRMLTSAGAVITDWVEELVLNRKNMIMYSDIFSDYMASGLTLSYTASSPYNVSISAGYIYLGGLITKESAQNLTMPEVTDGDYYIYINKNGNCQIVKSATIPTGYVNYIYKLKLTSTTMSVSEGKPTTIAVAADKFKAVKTFTLNGDATGFVNSDFSTNPSIYTTVNRITAGTLTNQDLNTYSGSSYWGKEYSAAAGNTISNKPSGVDNFSLAVIRSGDNTIQKLIAGNGATYIRTYTSAWTAWSLQYSAANPPTQFAGKSTSTNVTLTAASWSGSSAPYSYVVSNGSITDTNVIEVFPQASLTQTQALALASAMIMAATQVAGSITLKAFGEKPAVDIPITLLIRGDL